MLRKLTNYLIGNNKNAILDETLDEVIVDKQEDNQVLQKPATDQVNVVAASETDTTEEEEVPLKLNNRKARNEAKAATSNPNDIAQPVIDEMLTNVIDTAKAKQQAQLEEAKKQEAAQKEQEAQKQAQLEEEIRQTLLQNQQRNADVTTNIDDNPLQTLYEADKIEKQAKKDAEQQARETAEANFKKAEFGIEPKSAPNNTPKPASNTTAEEQKPAKRRSLFSQIVINIFSKALNNIIGNLYSLYKSITDGVKKGLGIKDKPTSDSQSFIQAEKKKVLASEEDIYATKSSINNYTEMYDPNLLTLSKKPVAIEELQPQLTAGQKISNFFRNLFTTKASKEAVEAAKAKSERIAERKVKSSEIMTTLLKNNTKNELFDIPEPEPVLIAEQQPVGLRHRRPSGLTFFKPATDSRFANANDALSMEEEKAVAPVNKIKFD